LQSSFYAFSEAYSLHFLLEFQMRLPRVRAGLATSPPAGRKRQYTGDRFDAIQRCWRIAALAKVIRSGFGLVSGKDESMQRRHFLKGTAACALAASSGIDAFAQLQRTHILTLSFDDGFKKSFYQIAEIYERFNLRACLNVIASAHLPGHKPADAYIAPFVLGDFDDWNALRRRGHEVMPHSWDHRNLTELPLEAAKQDIAKCIDYFQTHLDGFQAERAVYNFAYNASTPELDSFALAKVRAVRTQGDSPINRIPAFEAPVRLGCFSSGPGNCDNFVEQQVNDFLASPGGWLLLNVHGLDGEGWGPLSSTYLNGLLKRLVSIDRLEILPAGQVLSRVDRTRKS
jgi:peptidoglycan/xylan/chitin deacetylase (PgdA/CDA1 family)